MDEETRAVARGGPGPVYDSALRWLAATGTAAMCRRLGERPTIQPVLLSESLPGTAVPADALIRIAPDRLLDLEFTRRVDPDLGGRMLEYRGRMARRHPDVVLVGPCWSWAEGLASAAGVLAEAGPRI